MNPPQLRMRRWNLEDLPAPFGDIRTATHEDVPRLAELLTLAFAEEWTETRVLRELIDHPGVPTTFVAIVEGEIAATASYQLHADFPNAGWVHWVGADPKFQGHRLGRAVTLAVLHEAKRQGKLEAGLGTDDPRLAAIATYRALGFEPDPYDESHPERWATIFERLGAPR